MSVKAKKHLGQHFLTDKNIAEKIVKSLHHTGQYNTVLEVGPGMGILSDFLLKETAYETYLVDVDTESYLFLKNKYPHLEDRLINGDFLALNFEKLFPGKLAVIGNFPYNISSQILFKILGHRDQVAEVVGMFQKEVAERCAEKPGSKEYGILSVFLQAYYKVEYLFTVKAGVFNPPPKVLSAVIRLTRNETNMLDCDEKLFWQVVKAGFNQRRKTLRNALSAVISKEQMGDDPLLDLRAERLSVEDFVRLTNLVKRYQLSVTSDSNRP
ncbi:16S rRNA (adenine(1518)-N(6)/adenine(1519)-N(6))-dimethyltransferase RsmA [Hufsiella ginkgonis]|uniref:Ribosomal RNA small subunit methyltransferase A n=1 Tax=Hufsiella ginkgonis TaxID=2695274 RepID=A0A7K1Y3P0_9SPHI|nr:16S rRNA (adenine(1518)-N(6)/adenine(1519)-N(6))-dimethyltransferase RsmA [Hufsiella ginkgonis]MXV17895.1 16S rRNA (adenine(1518)-N(6)/adenine(1519)-N(6))-dimethyltransferase RsmA [Hufsiella ginkgonis]